MSRDPTGIVRSSHPNCNVVDGVYGIFTPFHRLDFFTDGPQCVCARIVISWYRVFLDGLHFEKKNPKKIRKSWNLCIAIIIIIITEMKVLNVHCIRVPVGVPF